MDKWTQSTFGKSSQSTANASKQFDTNQRIIDDMYQSDFSGIVDEIVKTGTSEEQLIKLAVRHTKHILNQMSTDMFEEVFNGQMPKDVMDVMNRKFKSVSAKELEKYVDEKTVGFAKSLAFTQVIYKASASVLGRAELDDMNNQLFDLFNSMVSAIFELYVQEIMNYVDFGSLKISHLKFIENALDVNYVGLHLLQSLNNPTAPHFLDSHDTLNVALSPMFDTDEFVTIKLSAHVIEQSTINPHEYRVVDTSNVDVNRLNIFILTSYAKCKEIYQKNSNDLIQGVRSFPLNDPTPAINVTVVDEMNVLGYNQTPDTQIAFLLSAEWELPQSVQEHYDYLRKFNK